MRVNTRVLTGGFAVLFLSISALVVWAGEKETAAAVKLGDVVEKKDEAAIKKAAEEVARLDFLETMRVFAPRAKGGAGVGPKEGGYGTRDGIESMIIFIAKKEDNAKMILEKGAGDVKKLADITIGMAYVTDLHTPKKKEGEKNPKDWQTWTADMKKAATDLAAAAEKKDSAAVKAAAFKLNRSCNDCHVVFRDSGN
jgi:hypothetical protein